MNPPSTHIRKNGFTLTEVLMSMAVFSILVPAILMTTFQLSSAATQGTKHASALSEARHVQQFFMQRVNASRDCYILDSGNKLILSQFNDSNGSWEPAAMVYSESDHSLLYYPSISNTTFSVLSDNAYRNNHRSIFSAHGSGADIDLYFGATAPMEGEKIKGSYKTTGTFVVLTAMPRNSGRIHE